MSHDIITHKPTTSTNLYLQYSKINPAKSPTSPFYPHATAPSDRRNAAPMILPTNIAASYAHLTKHIVPGPHTSSYFLPFALLPIALLIPPSVLSHRQLALVFLPLICACELHAWLAAGVDVISLDLVLWSFVLLVCRDPRARYRRVWRCREGEGKGGVVEEGYPDGLGRRVRWVLTLLVSLRLTGWRIGDPSHDRTQPPPLMSRRAFLRRSVYVAVQCYLILDVAAFYTRTDPYFHVSGVGIDDPFPPSAEMPSWLVVLRLLPPRFVRASVIAGQAYGMVAGGFHIPLIPAVGLNALGVVPYEWSPHTWPLPFGSFSAIPERGLRGLWGQWWHGVNRQFTAPPGRSLAQALSIPTNSIAGYALLTTSAFFFSGVMHMGLIPPEPQSSFLSAQWMRLYIAAFFWAQIPAFGFEVAVSKLVARFLPQALDWSMTRAIVIAWTAAWLCLTLPLLAIPFRELGYWHSYSVPVSLVRGLLGRGWWTW
ncbi:hypothetical protein BDR22DRAFT_169395 [Usnea florida]